MLKPTRPNSPVIERILDAYGLDYDQVLPPQGGYRNKAYPVLREQEHVANLILYKSEPGILDKIHHANLVSNYLAAQGFPTRQTLDPKIITLTSPTRLKYGALYNYLPGDTIPWEAYSMEHIKLLGSTMGRLHTELRRLPNPSTLPNVADDYRQITRRMDPYFRDPDVISALSEKLRINLSFRSHSRHEQVLNYAQKLPHQQALHMDMVRSNILFGSTKTPRITGILDFEKTAYGHPMFDVARTLAFLLVDCKFKTEAKIRKYFLYSGYVKRGQGRVHSRLLEPLLDLFLTYDFYKFLRHNPYDYLLQNEHFVRTRDILIQRGLLETAQDNAKIAAAVAKPVL